MNDMALKFDTLDVAHRLERGGFTREQAETQAEVLADVINLERLGSASRGDLLDTERALGADIAAVRTELKADIAAVRTELKTEIADVRHELREFKQFCMGQFNLLRWMTGFLLVMSMSVMYKLFVGMSTP
ncbi:coiled-coil domain-containing protein [Bordetella genomosp. 13]|uniref:coiled-coil domain-containing protein n=1 Tax=Bordetella genomosp. 13 TaxID=463040 RepID=UPI0011A5CC41|nr:coiled-coil domain-containing protein [Bordetella genomosp. 13]